jgi:hypothetical protein
MTAVTSAVRCPQLIYTSARRTLRGSGLGILAHSAAWPAELGLDQRRLGGLVRAPQRDTQGVAMTELGLIRRGSGTVLYRKGDGGTDSSGRRGNYLVHLLWDATGTLTPRELPLLMRWSADSLITLDPTADLEEAVVEPMAAMELALEEVDESAVAGAVERLLADSGEVRLPRILPSGRATVDTVFHAVPWRLLGAASCVDGEEPEGDEARLRVRLVGESWPDQASEFAHAVTRAASEGRLPDSSISREELDAELNVQRWANAEPCSLTGTQAAAVLRSCHGTAWAERHTRATLELLVAEPSLHGPLLAVAQRSERLRIALRHEGMQLVEEALLAGRSIPQGLVDLAGPTQSEASALLHRLEGEGRRLAPMPPDVVELVTAVLDSDPTVHPLQLLPIQQLPQLVRRSRLAEAVLRDLAWTQDLPARRAAARALAQADPGSLPRLASLLGAEEAGSLLAEESRRVVTQEDLERLLDTIAGIPEWRGFALRSVIFNAPREFAVEVMRRRGERILADDGWPNWLIDGVVPRRSYWPSWRRRRAAGDVPDPGRGSGRQRWR